ncbi:MAG: di-trans,poly-cis-decaprenylcistransferase [Wenzhouxiangella sp.]|nr:MAG: di-trans,poly-cis-decaprenylcistransferase [Wenzhouxiangella sp.]
MDGNGRWAQRQGKPRSKGHQAGSDALRRAVEAIMEHGIPYLTVYAFSSENWNRPTVEVKQLLDLFMKALTRDIRELDEHGVRVCFIGDRDAFNRPLRDGMRRAERRTAGNSKLRLNVAVNYGGRADVTRAARQLAERVQRGELETAQIDQQVFSQELFMSDIPEPDLLIRTGGEQRLSNFLLWQLAYTELYFSDVLWPDFSAEHVNAALSDFANRERRFGGLGQVQNA